MSSESCGFLSIGARYVREVKKTLSTISYLFISFPQYLERNDTMYFNGAHIG